MIDSEEGPIIGVTKRGSRNGRISALCDYFIERVVKHSYEITSVSMEVIGGYC